MDIDGNLKVKIWDFIAQFVCWEFCQNIQNLFPRATCGNETDLLTFFRDMVIQLTTKQSEADISKHEAVAKFIEELNMATKYEQFAVVVQFSRTMKRICPELEELTDDLITQLEEKFKICVKEDMDLIKDGEFYALVNRFSLESCKLLPVPDLVEVCGNRKTKKKQTEFVVTQNDVLNRMRRELIPEDVPQILDLIESGELYRSCFKDDQEDDGLLDISSQDLAEFQQKCEDLVELRRESSASTSGLQVDCTSTSPMELSEENDSDQDKTRAAQSTNNSLFRYNYSVFKTKKCHIELEDIVKRYKLKAPYYASYIESLPKSSRHVLSCRKSSVSDEDFMDLASLRPSKESMESKKAGPGLRHRRKFICSSCGKAFKTAHFLRTHKCKFGGGLSNEDCDSSSGSAWD